MYVEVSGLLHLRCQRCMGALRYPLYVVNTLLLVSPDEPLPGDAEVPDAPDCIVAGVAMDVLTLVEDEVLLELPYAPRHADGACGTLDDTARGSKRAASPFAGLAALKK